MEKLTITMVKDGDNVETKWGPKQKLLIQTKEYGNIWIDGFKGKQNSSWRAGDVVEVDSIQKREYKGTIYYGFRMPKMTGAAMPNVDEIHRKLDLIIHMLSNKPADLPNVNLPEMPAAQPNPQFPEAGDGF